MTGDRRGTAALALVVLAGLAVGVERGHAIAAVALAVALVIAWRVGGFAAVAAVCIGTIALGSSSLVHVKAAGGDERWVALFTLALWPAVSGRRPGPGTNLRVLACAAALLVLAAVSVAWSVDTHSTVGRTAAFAALLWVALIVIPLHAREPAERLALARWLAALCVTGAVVALILGLADPNAARVGGEAADSSAQQGLPRAYGALQGWLENANTLGLWCVLLAPCLLAVRPRRTALLASLPVLAAVLLSQSRSALLVGIVIGLVVLPLSPLRKLALTLGVAATVVAILLSPAHTVFNKTALRKFEDAGSTVRILTGAREEAWTATFQIVPAAPVQGFGFGSGEKVFALAGGVDYFRYFVGSTPSNGYLLMLLELGAIGVLFLLVTLGVAMREAFPARAAPTRRPFFFMATGVLIAGLVESIFTSPGSPFTILLWTGLGVAAVQGVADASEARVLPDAPRRPAPRPLEAAGRLAGRLPGWPRTAQGTLILSGTVGLAIAGLSLVPRVNAKIAKATPSEYDVVLGRLPDAPAAGPAVPFGIPADLLSLRIASAHLANGARYYPYGPGGAASRALVHAARLYLPNALPVRTAADAEWIVSYRAPALVPPGVVPARVYTLAPRVLLIKAR
jgi:O-antigen ligase